MFHHVKELQFNARVSKPDPKFAALLLEQFGGGNGELKAAMQYFVQAFSAKRPYPELYDLLMDIATEEMSHLEIVGATITMLTEGINGELKNAVETNPVAQMYSNKKGMDRENLIQDALLNPQFLVQTGGGPALTNASGVPWQGYYVNANGEPTVDLRSNIAAESRAKIVYEYLLKFTDDAFVQETLRFLMTREVTHFQQFTAALESIVPNFPPGVLQPDARFVHTAFNMSNGGDIRGPWNQGKGPWKEGTWDYISDPIREVKDTHGLIDKKPQGTAMELSESKKVEKELAKMKSDVIKSSTPKGEQHWSEY